MHQPYVDRPPLSEILPASFPLLISVHCLLYGSILNLQSFFFDVELNDVHRNKDIS